MASLLSVAGPSLLGEAGYNSILAAFQRAVKEKSSESFLSLVQAVRETDWGKFKEILGPLAVFAAPECFNEIAAPEVSTDAAFVVLLALVNRMELMSGGPYKVEHDKSRNLQQYNAIIQRFIQHDAEIEFRISELATLKFPLKMTSVSQVDSKISPAIQICDMMIGAAVSSANRLSGFRSGGVDPDDLLSIYRDDQIIHLLPDLDFAASRSFREKNQSSEMIEYLSNNLYRD